MQNDFIQIGAKFVSELYIKASFSRLKNEVIRKKPDWPLYKMEPN